MPPAPYPHAPPYPHACLLLLLKKSSEKLERNSQGEDDRGAHAQLDHGMHKVGRAQAKTPKVVKACRESKL